MEALCVIPSSRQAIKTSSLLVILYHSPTGLLEKESGLNIIMWLRIRAHMLHSTCLANWFPTVTSPSSGQDTTTRLSSMLAIQMAMIMFTFKEVYLTQNTWHSTLRITKYRLLLDNRIVTASSSYKRQCTRMSCHQLQTLNQAKRLLRPFSKSLNKTREADAEERTVATRNLLSNDILNLLN